MVLVPTLALAGSLAARPTNERAASGAFRTDNAFFTVLLIAVILFVGALTFLPADMLGPIADHFLGRTGQTF
jgi:K+-transporting ATPase ATPase A chain